jgi:hypothetical protein
MLMSPNPDGFVDHEVGVVRIDDEAGQPIAILVNFAAHPTILAWDNRLLSPDYPGTLRRVVESFTGATCLFLQGAAGNQSTLCDHANQLEAARWVGRQVGLEAARVAEAIHTEPGTRQLVRQVESSWSIGVSEYVSAAPADARERSRVRSRVQTVALPRWQRPAPTAAELEAVQALQTRLAEAHRQAAPLEVIRAANLDVRRALLALETTRRRSAPGPIDLEIQAIQLGPVALLSMPAEPFAEIGVAIKAGSPFDTTLVSGYSNGMAGYLPIPAAYPEGGYEIWVTPFAPDAAGQVIAASLDLLARLRSAD